MPSHPSVGRGRRLVCLPRAFLRSTAAPRLISAFASSRPSSPRCRSSSSVSSRLLRWWSFCAVPLRPTDYDFEIAHPDAEMESSSFSVTCSPSEHGSLIASGKDHRSIRAHSGPPSETPGCNSGARSPARLDPARHSAGYPASPQHLTKRARSCNSDNASSRPWY